MGNKGAFQPGNKLAAGHHNRGDRSIGKPYSDAAREFLAMVWGGGKEIPEGWPADRKEWTVAQIMVERHGLLAAAGSMDMTEWLIERAEGKTPMAPEDRAAMKGAASMQLFGGVAAIVALQMALGLRKGPVNVEPITDTPEIGP